MFLPALLTAGTIVWFYAHDNISRPALISLHHLFYLLGFGILLALLYFNQNKGLFFTLCLLIAYTLLNRLKYLSPDNFWETPAYLNLSVLLPLSLLVFYFLPEHKLLKRYNVYLLLGVLSIYALGEQLSNQNLSLSIGSFETYGCLSSLSLLCFGLSVISFYIRTVSSGQIMDYSLFFATILTGFGFYYAAEPHALALFFCLSLIIICLGLGEELYNDIYKDRLTGFGSRNAFIIQSKKFPLKYSVGIARLDNYDNLKKAFGKRGRKQLMKMVSERISSVESDAVIYRYSDDELALIFKNEDKNSAYNQMEQIRRSVASAEFMLAKSPKAVKLTISGSVSEKKRSDANALEVLSRVHKTLQKTSAFSFNITSKA